MLPVVHLYVVMRVDRAGLTEPDTAESRIHCTDVSPSCGPPLAALQQGLNARDREAQAAPCWLQAVVEVGLAAESDPRVHENSLVQSFEASLQWWLATRPEVSFGHVDIPHQHLLQRYRLHLSVLGMALLQS